MVKRFLLIPLMIVLVSGLIFGGCAKEEAPVVPTVPTEPAEPAVPTEPTVPAEPTVPVGPEGQQYGGILKIILKTCPWVFGACCLGERGPAWPIPAALVQEPLVSQDKMGRPTPCLATSWEEDPGGKFIIFHLREGVKFHDGTDFNAEAVKWNIDKIMETFFADLLGNVTSVDVIDEYTVRFNTSHYENGFWQSIASWTGIIASPTATAKEVPEEEVPYAHMVGTGPFKFVDWERDVFMKFERFDDYWQEGKPYVDGVEFIIIEDAVTAQTAFMAGEAQMILDLPPRNAIDLEEAGYEATPLSAWCTTLMPDGVNPDSPFGDKRVREAVEYAIDRQAIVDAFGYGYVEALNQACDSTRLGYIPDFEGRPYDPDKARELLAVAGYPDGFDTEIIASPEDDRNVLGAIQGYLSEVGINARLEIQEMALFDETVFVTGWHNGLAMGWVGGDPNHADSIKREYIPLPGEKRMMANVSVFVPDGWEEALRAALHAIDVETQEALTQELLRMIHDEAMVIPLWAAVVVRADDGSVHDTGLYEISCMLWNPADAWLSQ